MNGIKHLQAGFKKAHEAMVKSIKDLTDEQLHFNPMGKGNSIAFLFWHTVRTEDLVVAMMISKQKPVWNTQGWDVKLNMDPKSQGTGMSDEAARAFKITNMKDFLAYSEAVFKASGDCLKAMTEADLEKELDTPMGKMNVFQLMGSICIEHGIGHVAEMEYIKGLMK
jgi:hypothetical protein